MVEARRPAHKPAAPEDRLSAFSLPELDEIMRERGIVGTGKRFKADKVQLIADDLDGDTEALIEYEFRYGRSGD